MLSHLDLFSGIGGFALAARWAGFETIAFCEKDGFCRKVLRKNFGDVPCHGDIRTLSGEPFRGVELLTGGFPCQPFSVAGRQGGENDDRHLWPEMARVISEARPRWVVGENVAGFIGMALDGVLSDLAGLGYEGQAVVIPACAVNAPHRRDRVWIIAHALDAGLQDGWTEGGAGVGRCAGGRQEAAHVGPAAPQSGALFAYADGQRQQQQGGHFPEGGGRVNDGGPAAPPHTEGVSERAGLCPNGAAPFGRGRSGDGHEQGCVVGNANNAGRGQQRGSESASAQLATFERADWRAAEPLLRGGDDGLPNRVDRLRSLGNAIVPQVAYEILRLIADREAA